MIGSVTFRTLHSCAGGGSVAKGRSFILYQCDGEFSSAPDSTKWYLENTNTETQTHSSTQAWHLASAHFRTEHCSHAFLQNVFARFFISWLRFLFAIAPFSACRTWWQPRPRPGLKVTAENAQGFIVHGRSQSELACAQERALGRFC